MKAKTKQVTEKEFLAAVSNYGTAHTKKVTLSSKKDTELTAIEQKYGSQEKILDDDLATYYSTVKAYCEQNRSALFTDKKSMSVSGITLNFRTGKQKLLLLADNTWEKVVLLLKKKKLTNYVRTKEEVDKARIVADADKLSSKFESLGLEVEAAGENFYITVP